MIDDMAMACMHKMYMSIEKMSYIHNKPQSTSGGLGLALHVSIKQHEIYANLDRMLKLLDGVNCAVLWERMLVPQLDQITTPRGSLPKL